MKMLDEAGYWYLGLVLVQMRREETRDDDGTTMSYDVTRMQKNTHDVTRNPAAATESGGGTQIGLQTRLQMS